MGSIVRGLLIAAAVVVIVNNVPPLRDLVGGRAA
jgi:hypothetical protein